MREEGRVHVGRRRRHVRCWHHWGPRGRQPVGWHARGSRSWGHSARRVRWWLRHGRQRVQTWWPLPFVGYRWRAPVVWKQWWTPWCSQRWRRPPWRGHAQQARRRGTSAWGHGASRGRGPLQVGRQRGRRPRLWGRRPQGRRGPRGVHLRRRGPSQPHRGRRVVGCVLGRWWSLSDEWRPHRRHAPLVRKGPAPLRAALRRRASGGTQPPRGGPSVSSATHVVRVTVTT